MKKKQNLFFSVGWPYLPWQHGSGEKIAEWECRWHNETSRERDRYLIELLQHSKMKVKLSSTDVRRMAATEREIEKMGTHNELGWERKCQNKNTIATAFGGLKDIGHSILGMVSTMKENADKVKWGEDEKDFPFFLLRTRLLLFYSHFRAFEVGLRRGREGKKYLRSRLLVCVSSLPQLLPLYSCCWWSHSELCGREEKEMEARSWKEIKVISVRFEIYMMVRW